MKVTPALLNTRSEDFLFQYKTLRQYYDYFQIDIADGVFVPNTTITIQDIIKTVTNNTSLFANTLFDFHLMVTDYEKHIQELEILKKNLRINTILIHYSALRGTQPPQQAEIGIVLNPEDTVSQVSSTIQLNTIENIQIMTIVPGFQGNAFKAEQLIKIKELREQGYKGKIYLDGGVDNKTLPIIRQQEYQPDIIGIGHFLTKASVEELPNRVKELEQFLQTK